MAGWPDTTGRCTSRTIRCSYEKFYFTPGDLGFLACRRLGAGWDLDLLGPVVPGSGPLDGHGGGRILFYPTAIGWHPEEKPLSGTAQREAWITVQRAHAIANGVFVAAVNRVGLEMPSSGLGSGIEFSGTSFLAGPFGQILAQPRRTRKPSSRWKSTWIASKPLRRGWPFSRDRRIDAYGPLVQRFLDRSP